MKKYIKSPFNLLILPEQHPVEKCKGRIYRCRTNAFMSKQGEYVYQERMRLMKRMSCPGCKYCGHLIDSIHEQVEYSEGIGIENGPINNALFQLIMEVTGYDYWSGETDYDLKFVRIIEEEE